MTLTEYRATYANHPDRTERGYCYFHGQILVGRKRLWICDHKHKQQWAAVYCAKKEIWRLGVELPEGGE